jgi:GT2 family glycosyltransferase
MSCPRILVVLVLYKRAPEESESFTSLGSILRERPDLKANIGLLVYDNSPEAHLLPKMPIATRYISSPANPGLAAAYNSGLKLASEEGVDWLLLLDHDTLLNETHLEQLADLTSKLTEAEPTVCAIVPKLMFEHNGHQKVHSPHFMPRLTHHGVDQCFSGVATEELSAYNSGATLRVRDIEALGGFPIRYPMEFLDHAVFHALQKVGGKIWVMDSQLPHDLSTADLEKNVSLARYKNILHAERNFHMETAVRDRIWYRIRKLKQSARHLLKLKDKRFAIWDLRAALGFLGKSLRSSHPN